MRREIEQNSEEQICRNVLLKYGLKQAREYVKIVRRLEKEKSNLKYLEDKLTDSDDELVYVSYREIVYSDAKATGIFACADNRHTLGYRRLYANGNRHLLT